MEMENPNQQIHFKNTQTQVLSRGGIQNNSLLEEEMVTSRHFQQDLLPAIQNSYFSPQSRHKFFYYKVLTVDNESLLQKFQEKRQEMRRGGYSDRDLTENYLFLGVDDEQQAKQICQEGLKTGNISSSSLGQPQMGVQLCRHADILKPTPLLDCVTYHLIVFKVLKGHMKAVLENPSSCHLEPTRGFDCHVSPYPSNTGVSLGKLYHSTQVYLYDGRDEKFLEKPRQICPVAIVQFMYRDRPSPENTRLRKPVSREIQPVACESTEYVIWSGKLSVKGLFACCVQMLSPVLVTKPVKLAASINLSCKIGMVEGREKFLGGVTTLTRGKEIYNRGWYIIVCQMKASQSKSNFEKIRHYLTDKECMAVLKLEEDILLVMTDNEVTFQLGLTKHSYESNVHCIFLSKSSRQGKGSAQPFREEQQDGTKTASPRSTENPRRRLMKDDLLQIQANIFPLKQPPSTFPVSNSDRIISKTSVFEINKPVQSNMGNDLISLDAVESSGSPLPDRCSETGLGCQNLPENILGGSGHENVLGVGTPFQPAPGYSSKLAEALSLSSQETVQSVDINDLPPLIPWLPVNIPETATVPKSPIAESRPTRSISSVHEIKYSDHNNNVGSTSQNINIPVGIEAHGPLSPLPVFQGEEMYGKKSQNKDGNLLSEPLISESVSCKISSNSPSGIPCSGNSDLSSSAGISRPTPLEIPYIKREPVDEYFSSLELSVSSSSDTRNLAECATDSVPSLGAFSSWPRHFMDAFLKPKINRNIKSGSRLKSSNFVDSPMFTPEHKLEYEEDTGLSRIPGFDSLDKPVHMPELEPAVALKMPVYGPVARHEEMNTQLMAVDGSDPSQMDMSSCRSVKTEIEAVDMSSEIACISNQPFLRLYRSSSVPDLFGKNKLKKDVFVSHPNIHLLLDSGFWPKPPRTSLLTLSLVTDCFKNQSQKKRKTEMNSVLKRSSSLLNFSELTHIYGTRTLDIPERTIADLHKSAKIKKSKKQKYRVISPSTIEESKNDNSNISRPKTSGQDITEVLNAVDKGTPIIILKRLQLGIKESINIKSLDSRLSSALLDNTASKSNALKLKIKVTSETTGEVSHRCKSSEAQKSSCEVVDIDTQFETEEMARTLIAERDKKIKKKKKTKAELVDDMVKKLKSPLQRWKKAEGVAKILNAEVEKEMKRHEKKSKMKLSGSPESLKETLNEIERDTSENRNKKSETEKVSSACSKNHTSSAVKTENDLYKKEPKSDSRHSRHHKCKQDKHKEKRAKRTHHKTDKMFEGAQRKGANQPNLKSSVCERTDNRLYEAELDKEQGYTENLERNTSENKHEQVFNSIGKKGSEVSDHEVEALKQKTLEYGQKEVSTKFKDEDSENSKQVDGRTKDSMSENRQKLAENNVKDKLSESDENSYLKGINKGANRPESEETKTNTDDKEEIENTFSKVLNDIDSAKVQEIVAGSKKRKAEDHKTDSETKERRQKPDDPKLLSPKRKHSKTEMEKSHSQDQKTRVKSVAPLSKQQDADKVLSALNMGVSRVEASSLGRIPKKEQPSSKKVKKGAEDNESGIKKRKTERKKNKENKNVVVESHLDSLPSELEKVQEKGESHQKHSHEHLVSEAQEMETERDTSRADDEPSATASGRGSLQAHDDMIPRSDLDEFVQGQAPLYKIGYETKALLTETNNSLFTNVMNTWPEVGTIPGLGELENVKMSPSLPNLWKWKDNSKRQVFNAGSGIKCVLSGYDPVGKGSGSEKVDVTECLKAALHGVRNRPQLPGKDLLSEAVHKGLLGNEDWIEKKSVTTSLNSEGATSIQILVAIRSNHVEHEKLAAVKDDKHCTETDKDVFERHLVKQKDDRIAVNSGDNMSKPDLVLLIPGKVNVILDEMGDTSKTAVDEEHILDDREESSEDPEMLKQKLLDIHEIQIEKPGSYDKLCETYASDRSEAGPDKTSLKGGESPMVIEVKVKDKKEDSAKRSKEMVNVVVELDEDLVTEQNGMKGKAVDRTNSRHESGMKVSVESENKISKRSESDDRKRRSRSKSGEWIVLSSEGLTDPDLNRKDSPTKRRSRSISKSGGEIDVHKSCGARSRPNSASKPSKHSGENSIPRKTSSGQSSRAGSEIKDDKSSVQRSRHSSETDMSRMSSVDESSNKEMQKPIAERLETLAKKSVPASEAAKAESRHSRQYHPYKKDEKKEKKSRKPHWSFDMAYSDMNELLENLTTSFFKQSKKTPAPVPKTNARNFSYDRKPRRFAGYTFQRSEISKTPPRTRSPSPFDPESNKLGPELIPDLAEREKKADFLEDMFQQTKEETEEDEYNREQDVYGQEEDYDWVERPVGENEHDKYKKDVVKPLSAAMVIPGGPKTFLYSGTELDDDNDESLEIFGGHSSRPLQTEIIVSLPEVLDRHKESKEKGKSPQREMKSNEKTEHQCSNNKKDGFDQADEETVQVLVASGVDNEISPLGISEDRKKTTNATQETVINKMKEKTESKINKTELVSVGGMKECETLVKKIKDSAALLSVDSDSCLDWTDEEIALDKVTDNAPFVSNDDLSDFGGEMKYFVVDSIGGSDSEPYEDMGIKDEFAKTEDANADEGKAVEKPISHLKSDMVISGENMKPKSENSEDNEIDRKTENKAFDKTENTVLHGSEVTNSEKSCSVGSEATLKKQMVTNLVDTDSAISSIRHLQADIQKCSISNDDNQEFMNRKSMDEKCLILSTNGGNITVPTVSFSSNITRDMGTLFFEQSKIRSDIQSPSLVTEENETVDLSKFQDLPRSCALVTDKNVRKAEAPLTAEDDMLDRPKSLTLVTGEDQQENGQTADEILDEQNVRIPELAGEGKKQSEAIENKNKLRCYSFDTENSPETMNHEGAFIRCREESCDLKHSHTEEENTTWGVLNGEGIEVEETHHCADLIYLDDTVSDGKENNYNSTTYIENKETIDTLYLDDTVSNDVEKKPIYDSENNSVAISDRNISTYDGEGLPILLNIPQTVIEVELDSSHECIGTDCDIVDEAETNYSVSGQEESSCNILDLAETESLPKTKDKDALVLNTFSGDSGDHFFMTSDEIVDTEEVIFILTEEDRNSDMREVVGVVNSGLDSPQPEESLDVGNHFSLSKQLQVENVDSAGSEFVSALLDQEYGYENKTLVSQHSLSEDCQSEAIRHVNPNLTFDKVSVHCVSAPVSIRNGKTDCFETNCKNPESGIKQADSKATGPPSLDCLYSSEPTCVSSSVSLQYVNAETKMDQKLPQTVCSPSQTNDKTRSANEIEGPELSFSAVTVSHLLATTLPSLPSCQSLSKSTHCINSQHLGRNNPLGIRNDSHSFDSDISDTNNLNKASRYNEQGQMSSSMTTVTGHRQSVSQLRGRSILTFSTHSVPRIFPYPGQDFLKNPSCNSQVLNLERRATGSKKETMSFESPDKSVKKNTMSDESIKKPLRLIQQPVTISERAHERTVAAVEPLRPASIFYFDTRTNLKTPLEVTRSPSRNASAQDAMPNEHSQCQSVSPCSQNLYNSFMTLGRPKVPRIMTHPGQGILTNPCFNSRNLHPGQRVMGMQGPFAADSSSLARLRLQTCNTPVTNSSVALLHSSYGGFVEEYSPSSTLQLDYPTQYSNGNIQQYPPSTASFRLSPQPIGASTPCPTLMFSVQFSRPSFSLSNQNTFFSFIKSRSKPFTDSFDLSVPYLKTSAKCQLTDLKVDMQLDQNFTIPSLKELCTKTIETLKILTSKADLSPTRDSEGKKQMSLREVSTNYCDVISTSAKNTAALNRNQPLRKLMAQDKNFSFLSEKTCAFNYKNSLIAKTCDAFGFLQIPEVLDYAVKDGNTETPGKTVHHEMVGLKEAIGNVDTLENDSCLGLTESVVAQGETLGQEVVNDKTSNAQVIDNAELLEIETQPLLLDFDIRDCQMSVETKRQELRTAKLKAKLGHELLSVLEKNELQTQTTKKDGTELACICQTSEGQTSIDMQSSQHPDKSKFNIIPICAGDLLKSSVSSDSSCETNAEAKSNPVIKKADKAEYIQAKETRSDKCVTANKQSKTTIITCASNTNEEKIFIKNAPSFNTEGCTYSGKNQKSHESVSIQKNSSEENNFSKEMEEFYKCLDPLLFKAEMKECYKALARKKREIEDASKSSAVEILDLKANLEIESSIVEHRKCNIKPCQELKSDFVEDLELGKECVPSVELEHKQEDDSSMKTSEKSDFVEDLELGNECVPSVELEHKQEDDSSMKTSDISVKPVLGSTQSCDDLDLTDIDSMSESKKSSVNLNSGSEMIKTHDWQLEEKADKEGWISDTENVDYADSSCSNFITQNEVREFKNTNQSVNESCGSKSCLSTDLQNDCYIWNGLVIPLDRTVGPERQNQLDNSESQENSDDCNQQCTVGASEQVDHSFYNESSVAVKDIETDRKQVDSVSNKSCKTENSDSAETLPEKWISAGSSSSAVNIVPKAPSNMKSTEMTKSDWEQMEKPAYSIDEAVNDFYSELKSMLTKPFKNDSLHSNSAGKSLVDYEDEEEDYFGNFNADDKLYGKVDKNNPEEEDMEVRKITDVDNVNASHGAEINIRRHDLQDSIEAVVSYNIDLKRVKNFECNAFDMDSKTLSRHEDKGVTKLDSNVCNSITESEVSVHSFDTDRDINQIVSSRIFTDEEIELWDTYSTEIRTNRLEAKSSNTTKNNLLSVSLLSSAYDECSNESFETLKETKRSASDAASNDFKNSLAALRSYMNNDSSSSDSTSDSGFSKLNSNGRENVDEGDSSVKDIPVSSLDKLHQVSCSSDLVQKAAQKIGPCDSDEIKTNESCTGEMKKYLHCKWFEEGILSPDNSDRESVCNTSCDSMETVKAISDTDELYQSDAALHSKAFAENAGNRHNSCCEDLKPSLMSTKRSRFDSIKRKGSSVCSEHSGTSEVPDILDSSFAGSSLSNFSILSLAKLEERQKKLMYKILKEKERESSVPAEIASGSDMEGSKVKGAVSEKLADICSWIQHGQNAKNWKMLSKIEAGWDSSSSENEEPDKSKLETSVEYITIDSVSGSDKGMASSRGLLDAMSFKPASSLKSLGQLSEKDLKSVLITIKNDSSTSSPAAAFLSSHRNTENLKSISHLVNEKYGEIPSTFDTFSPALGDRRNRCFSYSTSGSLSRSISPEERSVNSSGSLRSLDSQKGSRSTCQGDRLRSESEEFRCKSRSLSSVGRSQSSAFRTSRSHTGREESVSLSSRSSFESPYSKRSGSYVLKEKSHSKEYKKRTKPYSSRGQSSSDNSKKRSVSHNIRHRSGSLTSRRRLSSRQQSPFYGANTKSRYDGKRYETSDSKDSGTLSSSCSDAGHEERQYSFERETGIKRNRGKTTDRYLVHTKGNSRHFSASNCTRKEYKECSARQNDRSSVRDQQLSKNRFEASSPLNEVQRKQSEASNHSREAHKICGLKTKLGSREEMSSVQNKSEWSKSRRLGDLGGSIETRIPHSAEGMTNKKRISRDIRPVAKKEKVVILHSTALACEKLGDLCNLITSLAQYSTTSCHWRALVHSRMILDLDEWRSANKECSSLLELLSKHRDDGHTELLPFHGCDEDKLTQAECAEQMLRKRKGVMMVFIIGGSCYNVQIRRAPDGPAVSTENPVQQLDVLCRGKKGGGKSLIYMCIGEQKGMGEKKAYTEFTFSVVVDGRTYTGTGRSKKEAKQAAAKAALIGRYKILTVPTPKQWDSSDRHIVRCSVRDFLELHLSSKHV